MSFPVSGEKVTVRPTSERLAACIVTTIGIAVFLSVATPCRGQALLPNSAELFPAVGGFSIGIETSVYRADRFVNRAGTELQFPGKLEFALGELSVSFSPIRDWAVGVGAAMRRTAYRLPEFGISNTESGSPGMTFFIDWAPERNEDTHPLAVRLGFFRAGVPGEGALTIADGIDRYFGALRFGSKPKSQNEGRLGEGSVLVVYGPPLGARSRYLEARFGLDGGRRVASLGPKQLFALASAGCRMASIATQEGSFFHNRSSASVFAGIGLDLRTASRFEAPSESWHLVVERDLYARNALLGWRATLAWENRF